MKPLMRILFFNLALFIVQNALAQNPLVKMWDYRYGGNNHDYLTCIQQTSDHGFLIGGYSTSQHSGDKTQDTWGLNDWDYWVVKVDSLGIKDWDRDFGGIDDDKLTCLQKTSDGGYILGGYSSSGISGVKTEDSRGGWDYWVVKLDAPGTILWDKSFGGIGDDILSSVVQTSDGGYILGGYSTSDISGDKTEINWDSSAITPDYWIVKIDSLGNKQWDKTFGGSGEDILEDLKQSSDGGFILTGYSQSPADGNKSEISWASIDYWIVKTDAQGNKQWDRDFGGLSHDWGIGVVESIDNGFVIGGVSSSAPGGNKTSQIVGGWDFWLIKTDATGTKLWEKCLGGIQSEDEFGSLVLSADGGFLLAGTSYSAISGDKTENNLGSEQTWVIKTDSLGNRLMDKTLLTLGHEEVGLAIEAGIGCYLLANHSDAMPAGHKTQVSQGLEDYLIVKFCDSTLSANMIGSRFLCPGTCADFLNLSTNALFYQWSFWGATPDTSTAINPAGICYPNPGFYDVQLIASNANGIDTLLLTNYITVYPSPPPQSITQSGDTLFALTGAASYQWYFNTILIGGSTEYFYVAPASGDYNVVATDANGCEVEAAIFNVVAALQSTVDRGLLTIYPNPVEDKLIIHKAQFTSETAFEISVFNVIGEKVFVAIDWHPYSYRETTIDCRLLSPGLYYLEITSGEKTFRTKFVKQ